MRIVVLLLGIWFEERQIKISFCSFTSLEISLLHYVRPKMARLGLFFLSTFRECQTPLVLFPNHLRPEIEKFIWILHLCQWRESNPGCQHSKREHYPFHHYLSRSKWIDRYQTHNLLSALMPCYNCWHTELLLDQLVEADGLFLGSTSPSEICLSEKKSGRLFNDKLFSAAYFFLWGKLFLSREWKRRNIEEASKWWKKFCGPWFNLSWSHPLAPHMVFVEPSGGTLPETDTYVGPRGTLSTSL